MPEQSPDLLMTNADLPDERERGDSSGAPGSFRTFWGPNPARSLAEWLCRPSGMFGGLSTPISFQRTIPGRSSIFVEKKRDRLSSDLGGSGRSASLGGTGRHRGSPVRHSPPDRRDPSRTGNPASRTRNPGLWGLRFHRPHMLCGRPPRFDGCRKSHLGPSRSS